MGAGRIKQGGVFIEIGADTRKFFGAINRVNQRIGRLGASLSSIGSQITRSAGAIAAPMGLALARFAQFDDAIRTVAAVTGSFGKKGAAAFQSLNDKARTLGATTSFTAVEVANLMTELGRAGFDPSQINNMTSSVLALARATGTDAAEAAGIMSTAIRSFSLDATDAQRVADLLATTANSTFNTVTALGEALSYAGTSAAQAGLSIEETTALLGALGNVGIQGSRAGTALRKISTLAGAEAEKLKGIFGVDFLDDDGNVRNLVQVFKEIAAATNDLPSGERIAKFNEAFGLLGITGAQAIGGAIGDIEELIDKIEESKGSAEKTAKEMDAGLGGSMRILMSAIEGVALAIGDSLAPGFKAIVDMTTAAAGGITNFIKANSDLIANIGGGVAAALAIGGAFLGVGTALQIVSFGFGGFLKVFGSVASLVSGVYGMFSILAGSIFSIAGTIAGLSAAPLIAVIAGFAALAVLVPQIGQALGSAFGGVYESAQAIFGSLLELTQTTLGGVYDAIVNGNLSNAADILWQGLYVGWLRGQNAIMNAVDPWISYFQDVFDSLGAYVYSTIENTFNNVGQALNLAGAVLMGIVDNIVNGIMNVWDNLEKSIRIAMARIAGVTKGFKQVEQEIITIEAEFTERKRKRDEGGIENRMAKAKEENQEMQQRQEESDRETFDNLRDRKKARQERNEANRQEREANLSYEENKLDSMVQNESDLKKDRSLADTLIQQLSETDNIDEFNTIISFLEEMARAGKLTEDQQRSYNAAVNQGSENIARKESGEDVDDGETKRDKMQDGAEAALGSGTTGTFSTAVAALALGGGNSAADRTANATEETAKNTRNMQGATVS